MAIWLILSMGSSYWCRSCQASSVTAVSFAPTQRIKSCNSGSFHIYHDGSRDRLRYKFPYTRVLLGILLDRY
ncbi:hypothetical protein BT93_F3151 [Corymbia citriodora subsp. variegata]|nr:hypothetical protein BT93_F3151 [Corymbia citriodora subsp. variegata]